MRYTTKDNALIAHGRIGRTYRIVEGNDGVAVENLSLNMSFGAPKTLFDSIEKAKAWCEMIEEASADTDMFYTRTEKMREFIRENVKLERAA